MIFRFCISDVTLHSAQQCGATDSLSNYVRPAAWLSEGLWTALFQEMMTEICMAAEAVSES